MKKVVNIGLSLAFMVSGAYAQSLEDAKVAIDAEQYAKAKGFLKTLVANKPKDAENFFYLGQVYLLSDNPDSAKIIFEQGLAADPKLKINAVGVASVDLYKGNDAAAESKFTELNTDIKKKEYEVPLYIGKAYLITGDQKPDTLGKPYYEKAVTYIEQAKLLNQKDADIYVSLGDAYLSAGRASDAFSAYRSVEDLDPNLLKPKVQMAVISKKARAWPEASEDLKKIVASNPDYAPTYRELAETYNAWGQFSTTDSDYNARNQEALKYYKQYMDRTDYSVESRIRYADFLIIAKDYKALQDQAQELAKSENINPKILRYLGYAEYQNGQYAESKAALDKFLSKVNASRVIAQDYQHLGLDNIALSSDTVNNTIDTTIFREGVKNLSLAITKDSTLAEGLSDIAKKYYAKKHFAQAAAIYKVGAQIPVIKNKNAGTDAFYWGLSQYLNYAYAKRDTTLPPPSKDILKDAIAGFAKVNTIQDSISQAYFYNALSYKLLDNDDPAQWQGIFIEPFQKYIDIVKSKGDAEIQKEKKNLVSAYANIGAYYVNKEQYEKAREAFRAALEIDPTDAYAKDSLDKLAPAAAGAAQDSTKKTTKK
ncbi:Tetratricopeptide repeat-containing protein [bacterium A37T11]|nr:Tetratricopeptide repeat-containing protein [bacterium A37T11]